jgi:tRNA(Arg) A34 adenosine deaminase TadA
MALARRLAARIETRERRYASDRRIAAVLSDRDGSVLAWAVNSSARDKTAHAEVLLVQGYCRATGSVLPEGVRIHVTLKSCKMCAGMILNAAADPRSIRVYYDEFDPGPHARLTALERAEPAVEFAYEDQLL